MGKKGTGEAGGAESGGLEGDAATAELFTKERVVEDGIMSDECSIGEDGGERGGEISEGGGGDQIFSSEAGEVGDLWREADVGVEEGMEGVGIAGGFAADGANFDDGIVEGTEAGCFEINDDNRLGEEGVFWRMR